MKRTLLAIVAAFVMITSANAQRLTDIQAEARFITDKMIVELGLNSAQRNSLMNINLNYLDGIRSYRDIDAYGWHYRNKQLKRMLNARQWKRFKEAYYLLEQQHLHIQHIQQVSQAQLSSQPPSPALLRQARQAVQVRQEVEARQKALRERIQALQEALRERIQVRQEALRERIQARQALQARQTQV